MRKSLAFASLTALAVAGLAGDAGAQACGTLVGNNPPPYGPGAVNAVPHDIVANTTWGGGANPSPICVLEPVFVQPGVTLTILPGTIVRGQPRAAAVGTVNHAPGAVVVTQGAKIIADGAPDDPIIMTTGAVDNNTDGVCDDGNGDGFFDPHPGFQEDANAGCIAAGTCVAPGDLEGTASQAVFCDADPVGSPMEPLASDGSFNNSLWGGLVLLGRAPTNLDTGHGAPGCTPASGAAGDWCDPNAGIQEPSYGYGFVEGLEIPGFNGEDAQCGGFEPHDSSGTVRYVSVRHGGDVVGGANELNGVTLCAVGDNTIFEFVEVYSNFDDGFEYFGGTVHSNHLVVAYVGDDTIDLDWGYTGTIQFALSFAAFFNDDAGNVWNTDASASGNRLGEFDGDDKDPAEDVNVRHSYSNAEFNAFYNEGLAGTAPLSADAQDSTPWPLSSAYVSNWTGIGAFPDGTNPAVSDATATGGTGEGVHMRHGFAGQVLNSAFVNLSSRACLALNIDGDSTQGHDVADHVRAGSVATPPLGLLRWITNSCDGSAALAAGNNNATGAADNGDAFSAFDTGLGCAVNIRSTGGGFAGLVQEDPTFDPKDFSSVGALYDPRPGGAGADCGVTPRVPGFDRAATYRGAFPAGVPELWTTGWTVLNLAGVLVD